MRARERDDPGRNGRDALRSRQRMLLVAAAFAFLLKAALAATSYGTNDVQTFEQMLETLQERGARTLYLEGTDIVLDGRVVGGMPMNHPPMVLAMLRLGGALRDITGLRLGFWLRLSCALADLLTLWALYRLFGLESERWLGILLVALAPASIMISGFHGNTDPIMIALVVLAVYLLEKRDAPWRSGVAFGLACSIKVWPLVLAPAFLLSEVALRRRAWFLASALGTALALVLPWHAAGFALIAQRVLRYGSLPGWWGITYLVHGSHAQAAARIAMIACMLASAAYMYRRVPSLFARCAVLTFLFLFLAPGFGPQYLAWAVPWTAAAGWRSAAAWHVATGVFLFGMYTAWSAGFPWDFANAHKYLIPLWTFRVGLVAWAVTALLIVDVWRRCSRPVPP
jgi:Glycosyltransferase family 87